jgi:hypothetical protein
MIILLLELVFLFMYCLPYRELSASGNRKTTKQPTALRTPLGIFDISFFIAVAVVVVVVDWL